jgi:GGDEF domain-containing protein
MSRKIPYILLILAASALTITAYLAFFRIGSLQDNYRELMQKSHQRTSTLFERALAAEDNMNEFLTNLTGGKGSPVLAAITDEEGTIQLSSRHPSMIDRSATIEQILEDIRAGRIDPSGTDFMVRYYDLDSSGSGQEKYYLFRARAGSLTLYTARRHQLPTRSLIMTGLECLLVFLAWVVIGTLVYLRLNRNPERQVLVKESKEKLKEETPPPSPGAEETEEFVPTEDESSRRGGSTQDEQREPEPVEDDIYAEEEDPPLARREGVEEQIRSRNEENRIARDALNQYVYSLFRSIYRRYAPENVSLYLKSSPAQLSKAYELRGKSFLKIDSSGFDTREIDHILENQLQGSSSVLLSGGKTLLIPVFHGNELTGLLEITGAAPFSGQDSTHIRQELEGISGQIHNFLIINEVMLDRETGLYTESAFTLRFHQLASRWEQNRRPFGCLIIRLFDETPPSGKDYNTVVRLVAPVIEEKTGKGQPIYHYRGHLALLLEGESLRVIREKGPEIKRELSRFRITTGQDRVLKPTPSLGLAVTSEKLHPDNLVDRAEQDLLNSRTW